LKAQIAWFTSRLLDLAVQRLPEDQRARFAEEWASHLNDISGDIGKVVFARGCVSAAQAYTFPRPREIAAKDLMRVLPAGAFLFFPQSGILPLFCPSK
jgi:hypothetical protein